MSSFPRLGLGTYRLRDTEAEHVIRLALDLGYRAFDTASVYRNEEAIGRAIKSWLAANPNQSRANLFITSKLAPKEQGEEEAYQACLDSLERLQMEYLDCYLIHWPGKQGLKANDARNAEHRAGSWRALQRLQSEGKVRIIGVSNYTIAHLDQLDSPPQVLQTEIHPLLYQPDLVAYCQEHKIQLQAYSSFGEGVLVKSPPEELEAIAARNQCTIGQVLLQWALQQNIAVIPKSTNEAHLKENINVLKLPPLPASDMAILNSGLGQPSRRFCWDPNTVA